MATSDKRGLLHTVDGFWELEPEQEEQEEEQVEQEEEQVEQEESEEEQVEQEESEEEQVEQEEEQEDYLTVSNENQGNALALFLDWEERQSKDMKWRVKLRRWGLPATKGEQVMTQWKDGVAQPFTGRATRDRYAKCILTAPCTTGSSWKELPDSSDWRRRQRQIQENMRRHALRTGRFPATLRVEQGPHSLTTSLSVLKCPEPQWNAIFHLLAPSAFVSENRINNIYFGTVQTGAVQF